MAAAKGQTDRARTAFEPPLLIVASLVLSFALSRFLPLPLWPGSLSRFGEVAGVVMILGRRGADDLGRSFDDARGRLAAGAHSDGAPGRARPLPLDPEPDLHRHGVAAPRHRIRQGQLVVPGHCRCHSAPAPVGRDPARGRPTWKASSATSTGSMRTASGAGFSCRRLLLAAVVASGLTACAPESEDASLAPVQADTARLLAGASTAHPRGHPDHDRHPAPPTGCRATAPTGSATPHIDRLAAEGVRFANASSTVPFTLPAHSSIMTGLYPPSHGVRENVGYVLGADRTTLAERFRDAGYRTGGFVSAFVLDARWGIGRGFDTYVDDFDLDSMAGANLGSVQRSGPETIAHALEWLDGAVSLPATAALSATRASRHPSSCGCTCSIRTIPTSRPSRSGPNTRDAPTTAKWRTPIR